VINLRVSRRAAAGLAGYAPRFCRIAAVRLWSPTAPAGAGAVPARCAYLVGIRSSGEVGAKTWAGLVTPSLVQRPRRSGARGRWAPGWTTLTSGH